MKAWADITHDQRIERWENVQRVLENLPEHEREKHWDMGTYGLKDSCGTVACAAGHCAMDLWFIRRGFKMVWYPTATHCSDGMRMGDDVEKFFGFTGSSEIFWDSTKRPVETVIEEVKNFVRHLHKNHNVG